uniref:Uncharacterized protein n=1 Tax=Triticum urartu TaxID=4572 RepID=A0A8R7PMM7_TRIUA
GVLEDHLDQAGVYSLGSKVNGVGLVLQLSNSCTQTISGARASMLRIKTNNKACQILVLWDIFQL